MSVIARLTSRIARSSLPRRTVRLRMTLLYGGLFLVSGAALLGVTYVLTSRAVSARPAKGFIPAPGTSDALPPPEGARDPLRRSGSEMLSNAAEQILAHQKAVVMQELLVQSGIALALMLVISIVLGWIVAGRMLRPLRTITATARDISATSLHQRLALDGPADELKELGDTFDGLLSRLEASFQAQRQFVANASHELRTPLARQRTLGQVSLSDPDATVESLRAAHQRILAAGAQQERLIEALLTLARSQGGIDVREPFDLARMAHEVVEARSAEARYRGITFRCSISPALAAGHRNLAERLVTNLVDNALRHNMPHGRIDVTTRTVEGRATLTLTNTGPLVPPNAIEQLFQPFQRLGATRAARTEGLGLGMSIVAAIADAHDADITTSARPGGGLTVTVTFPDVSNRAAAALPRPEQATARAW
ncbi:HAMP domain-containing sensor histidine kinase [Streptomyces sp. ISL-100]|uniref:sensor histidine kinase n=1 Tax=Streptomyces sp. ISL-100 TaxID=2819173 RepID=UPI001BE83D76|nr:HAMP domain-containing sensor histidine kinase [Streptomyces sp. ISL-100]MBT2398218.1 HAMP domain-containing histidine kinase [Streptomyces sp. ISL-100]